ncbi:MAG: ABC transporter ATP-binding protein [Chloroflexi bacterium]|nr:ABC transporter ATP-binding protein [Chloroflexota bacterium]
MMPILEIAGLYKSFGGLMAVNNVHMSVPTGEIRGLIGPNGSGKTTVINLISGVYLADEGEVKYRDKPITGLQVNQISQTGLLRTFQIPKLFGSMSLFKNMLIPYFARMNPVSGGNLSAAMKKADELINLAGLSHLRDSPAKVLSGGQQALLQIARGFMVDDLKLYLLDEPFAGVNPIIKESINRLILKENEEKNIAFLLVSHEMEQISKLCHQVTVLAEGSVIAEGTLEDVAQDPYVVEAYLGGHS